MMHLAMVSLMFMTSNLSAYHNFFEEWNCHHTNNLAISFTDDLRFGMGNGNLPNYNFQRLMDLSGLWKFEIGDDTLWADPQFDDRDWEEIRVPSTWEDEGFPGYDGYAWYRTHFKFKDIFPERRIFLYLGYIDDVDEVYLNGKLIGFTGSFPPSLKMADYFLRRYIVPREYINVNGDNVLSVRIYDHHLAGGIVRGKIGLYVIRDELIPDLDLTGLWKFCVGDSSKWREKEYDDAHWRSILVPAIWETQGHKNYDGFAWYRQTFRIPNDLKKEKLILLLGKIDDLDETYLNGHLIGRHGKIYEDTADIKLNGYCIEQRAYFIPKSYLQDENVIAVRVYDGRVNGGIYDGPIGIIKRQRFLDWQDQEEGNLLIKILRRIFGE